MKYSVVIPCYNSAHTIEEVVELLKDIMIREEYRPFEIILVDDFSSDQGETISKLVSVSENHQETTVIELARNSGQHNAIMAGLNYAQGDIIILMDDDMQTHPSQLPTLLSKIDEGYDVVYGYYPNKKHSGFRNFGSWFNYTTVRVLIGKPKELKTSSYCIMRKYVRDSIINYPTQYPHMQGLVLRTVATDKIASVPIEHFNRAYGTSNYSFKKLISLWSNIAGFSTVPLVISRRCGLFISLIGLIGIVVLIIRKLMLRTQIIGWTSTMMTIILFSGIILITLGVVGEYVGRMFLTLSNYPQYVVRNVYKNGEEVSPHSFNRSSI